MTDRSGLTGESTAIDINEDIKLVVAFNDLKRLANDHLQGFPAEVVIQFFLLTVIFPVPGLTKTRATDDFRRPVP